MTYTCPVCGFDEMPEPPKHFEICPSCGTEFGNDDYWNTREELTLKWIAGGLKWWDEEEYRPANWSPFVQIRNIELTDKIKKAISDYYEKASYGSFVLLATDKTLRVSTPRGINKPTGQTVVIGNLSFKFSSASSDQRELELLHA